ncbi:MAG: hypothetical protein K9J81_00680 [Desulfohalobiaceae bacterium]|nr:hypothetical protein [Desulfohalobiaceae bacterium]
MMLEERDRQALQDKVDELEQMAKELLEISQELPAFDRNTHRILASLAMLKINLGMCDQD